MPELACPICARRFEIEESPARPFCSERCKQIDLGRWLDEAYGMPFDSEDELSQEIDLEQQ